MFVAMLEMHVPLISAAQTLDFSTLRRGSRDRDIIRLSGISRKDFLMISQVSDYLTYQA